jgi:membrane AbrB-like protein
MPPAPLEAGRLNGPRALRVAATAAVGVAAALLFQAAQVPLPWMLGPLAIVALAGVLGAPVAASNRLRNLGQAGIGLALGLYFTPAALVWVLKLAPALVLGIAWAFLLGWCFYRALLAVNGPGPGGERATAFYAAAIGGASEMAVLAEKAGGQVDRVAAAHSLRLLLVVSTIPLAFQWAGVHGADVAAPASTTVHAGGFLALLAVAAVGVALLQRWRVPNPWVLGALAATAVVTGLGAQWSALPPGVSSAAQCCIGLSLGSRFTPAFVQAAPRWLATVAVGTLVMIGASVAFAWGLVQLSGQHWATLILATSPGGIAEMAITAKVLQLGVPVVTTFHVTRYVAVLVCTPWMYRWAAARP